MRNRAATLYHQATRVPTKAAVIYEDRAWTFAQLLLEAQCYAAGLASAGFKRGDKLAIMMATRPEFIAIEYAAFILGGVVVPMNVHYLGHEIEFALDAGDVDYLVMDTDCAAEAPNARLDCGKLASAFGVRQPDWREGVTACLDELGIGRSPSRNA